MGFFFLFDGELLRISEALRRGVGIVTLGILLQPPLGSVLSGAFVDDYQWRKLYDRGELGLEPIEDWPARVTEEYLDAYIHYCRFRYISRNNIESTCSSNASALFGLSSDPGGRQADMWRKNYMAAFSYKFIEQAGGVFFPPWQTSYYQL